MVTVPLSSAHPLGTAWVFRLYRRSSCFPGEPERGLPREARAHTRHRINNDMIRTLRQKVRCCESAVLLMFVGADESVAAVLNYLDLLLRPARFQSRFARLAQSTERCLHPRHRRICAKLRRPLESRRLRMKYEGKGHCGEIAFSVEGELDRALDCNCSICAQSGYLH